MSENAHTTKEGETSTCLDLNVAEKQQEKSSNKICMVCSDRASGMHFGVMSCEGCKGFFRRSVKKNAIFTCSYGKQCSVSKESRKHCQACRFNACLAAGMNSALILTDEEVVKKRDLIKSNREKRLEQQTVKKNEQEEQRLRELTDMSSEEPPVRMTMDQKLLIETLLKGHNSSYDFDYEEYDTFRGKETITTPDRDGSLHNQTSLAWLVASMSKVVRAQDSTGTNTASSSSSQNVSSSSNVEAQGTKIPSVVRTSPKQSESNCVEENHENSEVFASLHGISQTCSLDNDPNCIKTNDTAVLEELKNQGTSKNEPENRSIPQAEDNTLPASMEIDSISYLHRLLKTQGFSALLAEDSKSKQLLQHFLDIMTWGIKKVIDFCKSIPLFQSLSIADQIVLLKGGCLEMLVLRSYFAFSSNDNKYMSDKFQYNPSDFLQAGASVEFIEKYNSLHLKMRKMELKVEEICLLLALVLFSPDRLGLEEQAKVEKVQTDVAITLRAYEYTHRSPKQAQTTYCEILLILPVLRTINILFASDISSLQEANESDMNPLILEVNSSPPNEPA